jgi:hypothetical protein
MWHSFGKRNRRVKREEERKLISGESVAIFRVVPHHKRERVEL